MDLVEKPCLKEQCGKENKDNFNISLRLPHASTLTGVQHTQTDKSKENKILKNFKSDIILNMICTYTLSYMQYTYTYNQYIHISGKMINNCAPGTLNLTTREAKAKG